jgi:hypothetical protein
MHDELGSDADGLYHLTVKYASSHPITATDVRRVDV